MHAVSVVSLMSASAISVAASGAVFSTVEVYSDTSPALAAWQAATGSAIFGLETFDSYTGGPNLDIPPGTFFVTPSGMQIFFDESADASAASRAGIDAVNTSWTGTPPFEGSASFEGFSIVPGGVGTGTNIIQFIFPDPVIGFAGDWESAASGGDLIVLIDGSEVVAFDDFLTGGVDGFLGYVHDSSFTTITFMAENLSFAGEVWDVDNVRWAVIPAPGSMFVLGAAGVIGWRRRR